MSAGRGQGRAGGAPVLPDRTRRRLVAASPAIVLLSWRPAFATPEVMTAAIREVTGGRATVEGGVEVDLPRIADNGNVVPLTVRVDSPMLPEDHVRAIHVFAEENPLPRVVSFHLGPHYPKGEVATRIRLARSQRVVVVAETSAGTFRTATAQVEVTISACGDE